MIMQQLINFLNDMAPIKRPEYRKYTIVLLAEEKEGTASIKYETKDIEINETTKELIFRY